MTHIGKSRKKQAASVLCGLLWSNAFTSSHSFSIHATKQSPFRAERDRIAAGRKIASLLSATASQSNTKTKTAVLICPAQFCVPADYQPLLEALKQYQTTKTSICTAHVAPLPRTEWIKVAKQLPTKAFLEAKLDVKTTLKWYFDAMDEALANIYSEVGEDVNICLVGHSIGGWVARAYLGGLSGSSTAVHHLTQQRCTSFLTLGTPHSSPASALVDQTRGLLAQIERTAACSPDALAKRGIDVTCVGSNSVPAKIFTTNMEELVAATSYIPLQGFSNVDDNSNATTLQGDGIVPSSLAFMNPPARRVVVEQGRCGRTVKHAHVLPTPWNLWDGYAPSIKLPEDGFCWYGSESVLDQWVDFIR